MFFYNSLTGETAWEDELEDQLEDEQEMQPGLGPSNQRPPTPETDYPDLLTSYPEEDYSPVGSFSEPGPASPFVTPPGWSCHVSPDGQTVYTNNITEEQWVRLENQHGKTYFYNPDDASVQWALPQVPVPVPAPRNSHKSNQNSETPAQATPPEEKIKTLDKAGVLHRTKIVDKGKRLRKKHWSASWTVLEGGILTFFKDSKNSAASGLRQPSKLSTPEFTVDLKGASLTWAPKDKSSKKNVLEVSGGGEEEERESTDGLGSSLSRSPLSRGTLAELRLEFSGLKTKAVPTLGICPQCFLASGFCSSFSRSRAPWSPLSPSRGPWGITLSCLEGHSSSHCFGLRQTGDAGSPLLKLIG